MITVPFIPAHLDNFNLQKEQLFAAEYVNDEFKDRLVFAGPAHTGIIDGRPYVIAGVIKTSAHTGSAWALLTEDSKEYMLSCTKAISAFLDSTDIKRIQTAVRRDFKQGHRWAKMLGFTNETPEMGMKGYGIHGETYDLYSRIK